MKQQFEEYLINLGYTKLEGSFKNIVNFNWIPKNNYSINAVQVLLDSEANYFDIRLSKKSHLIPDGFCIFKGIVDTIEDLDHICRILNIKDLKDEN